MWKPKGRSNAEPGLWAQDHKTVKSVMESASNQNVSIGEPMYRRIVEAVPEGIWVVDAQGLTIFSNRRMAEILGIDELIPAQSCFAWVFPEELADTQRQFARTSLAMAGHSNFGYAAVPGRRYGSVFRACLSTTMRVPL